MVRLPLVSVWLLPHPALGVAAWGGWATWAAWAGVVAAVPAASTSSAAVTKIRNGDLSPGMRNPFGGNPRPLDKTSLKGICVVAQISEERPAGNESFTSAPTRKETKGFRYDDSRPARGRSALS